MLFKLKRAELNDNNEVEEKIRMELISNLKLHGIDISNINIDLKTGSLNVSLCIRQ